MPFFFFNPFNKIIQSNNTRKCHSILWSPTVNRSVDIMSWSGYINPSESVHVSALFPYSSQGRKRGKKPHSCFHNTVLYQCLVLPHPPRCLAMCLSLPDSSEKPHWFGEDIGPSNVCSRSSDIFREVQGTREAVESLQQNNKYIFSKICLWSQLIIIS